MRPVSKTAVVGVVEIQSTRCEICGVTALTLMSPGEFHHTPRFAT